MSLIVPDPSFYKEYNLYFNKLSEGTRKQYIYCLEALRKADTFPKEYFSNEKLKGKALKINAYRSYLRFICKSKKLLDRGELMDLLDSFELKNEDKEVKRKRITIPKEKWNEYISKAPNRSAKFGLWMGFNFGLRLSEIIHIRVQDVDLKEGILTITPHEGWRTKNGRKRVIPLSRFQTKIFKRFVNERPELSHEYLLYNNNTKFMKPVEKRTFQRWVKLTGLHTHVLRYSFATHYYNESKDVKLISKLLGHSNVVTTSNYLQLTDKEVCELGRELFTK